VREEGGGAADWREGPPRGEKDKREMEEKEARATFHLSALASAHA